MRYLILLVLFLSSCNPSPSAPPRTLRLNFQHEPLSFDPRRGGDLTSSSLHFLLFDGLTKYKGEGLAEQILTLDGGTRYQFKLREAKWSDGTAVTAYDFVHSWRTILTPSFPSPHSNLFYPIKNAKEAKQGLVSLDEVAIRALDPYTLEIELNHPSPYFLDLLSFCAFAPTPPEIDAKWAVAPFSRYLCNGPFRLKSFEPRKKICLEKNPHYWNSKSLSIDEIHISLIADETAAFWFYEKGDLDLIGSPFTSLAADSLSSLKERDDFHLTPIASSSAVYFNTKRFPFTNAKIRKAFSLAIDREAIVEHITCADEVPAYSPLPPLLGNPLTPTDPQEAKKFFAQGLEELGLSAQELPPITLLYSKGALNHTMAQILQQMWSQLFSIPISIENAEFISYINRLAQHDFTVGVGKWMCQSLDPLNVLDRFKYALDIKNFTSWEDPVYRSLLEKAQRENRGKIRTAAIEQATLRLMEEAPIAPLYHANSCLLIQPHVQGVVISPLGFIHFEKVKLN